MGYKLKLELFEGPLDLLLYLIKKNEIDIYNIPITEITEQYMEYIQMMKLLDLDIVGDFLVMAATLLQIKSKMLLPPDPTQEVEEEDPRNELVRRLEEYRQFKAIAENFKVREEDRQNYFPRRMDEELLKELIEDSKEVYVEATLFDLINALSDAIKKAPENVTLNIDQEEFTVEMKIHVILHALLKKNRFPLLDLFTQARNKEELIVTFVAILELARLREIIIVQNQLFDSIEVVRNEYKIEPPNHNPSANQENHG